MRRRGQTAAEWEDFIPRMSPGDLFITPGTYMTPETLHDISISLEKVFGPDSPVPTRDQVHHVEISDEALHATFRYFTPPTRNYAHSVSVGSDGKPWFTEFDNIANRVASFDLATQQFHEYEIPTTKAMPHNPWVARNGQVWVTEAMANKLAVIDPETGKVKEFSAPAGAGTHTLREDSAGDIWASGSKKSLRFNPRTQKFDTYDIAGYDLAVDSHNNGWSTNGPKGTIDRVDPKTGQIKRYPVPGATFMRGIEVDAQDNVWFGDVMGHRLGKIDPRTEQMTFYHPPTANFSPYGIIVDKKTGHLWLADYLGANVTRFDPATGKFTEFPFPSRVQMIRFFAEDPQGRVWFTDFTNGKIGVLETDESKMAAQR
jgi:virginiamycin B lyase